MSVFYVGQFKPTDIFEKIAAEVENQGLSAPAVAAGMLAYFMDGSDFDGFVECLVEDGLSKEGLASLAMACLKPLQEEA